MAPPVPRRGGQRGWMAGGQSSKPLLPSECLGSQSRARPAQGIPWFTGREGTSLLVTGAGWGHRAKGPSRTLLTLGEAEGSVSLPVPRVLCGCLTAVLQTQPSGLWGPHPPCPCPPRAEPQHTCEAGNLHLPSGAQRGGAGAGEGAASVSPCACSRLTVRQRGHRCLFLAGGSKSQCPFSGEVGHQAGA